MYIARSGRLRDTVPMEHQFWHARWERDEIGFHERQVHAMLDRHWPIVAGTDSGAVLVPLCGKSLDMVWLAQQGHGVVGAELSEIAVRDFFAGEALTPTVSESGALRLFTAGDYRLWCGDFLALTAQHTGRLTLAYDRAALIALPPAMRRDYARSLLDLLAPGARILLITLQYDDAQMKGPPFNVPLDEVASLFASACELEQLEQGPSLVKGRFEVQQTATLLTVTR